MKTIFKEIGKGILGVSAMFLIILFLILLEDVSGVVFSDYTSTKIMVQTLAIAGMFIVFWETHSNVLTVVISNIAFMIFWLIISDGGVSAWLASLMFAEIVPIYLREHRTRNKNAIVLTEKEFEELKNKYEELRTYREEGK